MYDTQLDVPQVKNMHKVGTFLQDEILLLNEKLILLPSVRFDYSNYTDPQYTARFGATYEFMPNQRIKFNVGNAFKTPTMTNLAGLESNGSSGYIFEDKVFNTSGTEQSYTVQFLYTDGTYYYEGDTLFEDALAAIGTYSENGSDYTKGYLAVSGTGGI